MINHLMLSDQETGDSGAQTDNETNDKPAVTVGALQDALKSGNDDDPVKKWYQSELDRHFSKSLETWKENNLNALVEKEIEKRFPAEDEKDKENRQLKAKLEEYELKEKTRKVTDELKKEAKEKGLPEGIAEFIADPDEGAAKEKFEALAVVLGEWKESIVGKKRKETSIPPAQTGSQPTGENPFKTGNLTKMSELYKENPDLARQLAKEAGYKL